MSTSQKAHICFVIPLAYSLYNANTSYNFGGAEVRSSLFAKALARHKDFKVSVIVNNHGHTSSEMWDGVAVYAHTGYYDDSHWISQSRQKMGLYFVRTSTFPYIKIKPLTPKTLLQIGLLGLRRLFQQVRSSMNPHKRIILQDKVLAFDKYAIYDIVNADIYCVFGTRISVSEIVAFCKARNKKFVFFGASDRNFSSLDNDDPLKSKDAKSVHSTKFVIDAASLIIAQTSQQSDLVRLNFDKEALVIRNPIALDDLQSHTSEKYALWIGRSHPEKDPLLLIKLAIACPAIHFVMIMNQTLQSLHNEILAQCPDNVTVIENVAYADIETYFANALVFINTSPLEGFPNTFLQAGKYSKPLLTFAVDPDGYITKNNCGFVANGDFETMKRALEQFISDHKWRKELGKNNYHYVQQHHNLTDKVKQLAQVLKSLDKQ
ncbi:MAG: glycosyltransferase family 4 protein [Phototrophicaceae bacterium]